MRFAVKNFRGCGADLLACFETGVPCSAVCIPRIDRDYAHVTCTALQMSTANDDGSSNDSVAGEHCRSACRLVGNGNGKVGFAAWLDSGFYRRKAEA